MKFAIQFVVVPIETALPRVALREDLGVDQPEDRAEANRVGADVDHQAGQGQDRAEGVLIAAQEGEAEGEQGQCHHR